jgi:hypothetical protein
MVRISTSHGNETLKFFYCPVELFVNDSTIVLSYCLCCGLVYFFIFFQNIYYVCFGVDLLLLFLRVENVHWHEVRDWFLIMFFFIFFIWAISV